VIGHGEEEEGGGEDREVVRLSRATGLSVRETDGWLGLASYHEDGRRGTMGAVNETFWVTPMLRLGQSHARGKLLAASVVLPVCVERDHGRAILLNVASGWTPT